MYSFKHDIDVFFLLALCSWTAQAQAPDILGVSLLSSRSTSIRSTIDVTAGTNLTLYNVAVRAESGPDPRVDQEINGVNSYAVTLSGLKPFTNYTFQLQLVMIGNESVTSPQVPLNFLTAPAIVEIRINRIGPHTVYSVVNVTAGADLRDYNVIVFGDHGRITAEDQSFNGTSAYAVAVGDLLPLTDNTLKYTLKMANSDNVESDEVIQQFTTGPGMEALGIISVRPHSASIRVDITAGANMRAYEIDVLDVNGSFFSSETDQLDATSYSVHISNLIPYTAYTLYCRVKKISDDRVYSGELTTSFITSAGIEGLSIISVHPHTVVLSVGVTPGGNMTEYKVVVTGTDGSVFPSETSILDNSSYSVAVSGLAPHTEFTLGCTIQKIADDRVFSGEMTTTFTTSAGINGVGIVSVGPHSAVISVAVYAGSDISAFHVVVLDTNGSIFSSQSSILDASSFSVHVSNLTPYTNYTLYCMLKKIADDRVFSGQVATHLVTGAGIAAVDIISVHSHSAVLRVGVTPGGNMTAFHVVVSGIDGSILSSETDILDSSSYSVVVTDLLPVTNYTLSCMIKMIGDDRVASGVMATSFRTAPLITGVTLNVVQSRSIEATISVTAGINMAGYNVTAIGDDGLFESLQQDIQDDKTYLVTIVGLDPFSLYKLKFILALADSDTVYSEQVVTTFTTAPLIRGIDVVVVRSQSIKLVVNVTAGINMQDFNVIAMSGNSLLHSLQQVIDDADTFAVTLSDLSPFRTYELDFSLKRRDDDTVTSEEVPLSLTTAPAIKGIDLTAVRSHSLKATVNVTSGVDLEAYNLALVGFGSQFESLDQEIKGDQYHVSIKGLDPSTNYTLQFAVKKAEDDTVYSSEFDQDLLTAPLIADISITRIAPHSVYSIVNVTAGTDLEGYNVVAVDDQGSIGRIEQLINDATSYAVAVHGLVPLTNFTFKYYLRMADSDVVYSEEVLQQFATGAGIDGVSLISAQSHSADIRVDVTPGSDITAFTVVALDADGSIVPSQTDILDLSAYSVHVSNLVPSTNYTLELHVKKVTDDRVYSGEGTANFVTEGDPSRHTVAIVAGSVVAGVVLIAAIIGLIWWRRRSPKDEDGVHLQMDFKG